MTTVPPFRHRRLTPADVPAAAALAAGVGVHGVYIANILAEHPRLGAGAEYLAFEAAGHLVGMAYFGPRGNLLVLEAAPGALDPGAAAAAILAVRCPWRIVLAPASLVDELVSQGGLGTLVNRKQVYYQVDEAGLVPPAPGATEPVRPAEKKDLEALMQAALQLNQADLQVDPWRVDRDWLKRSTKNRIRQLTTFVIGPVGAPRCKLDLGSSGPAGVVIEGVYTWPEARGLGYASYLVASVAVQALADAPLVCLHVAEDNAPARRAYEKCGMTPVAACQLMLRT